MPIGRARVVVIGAAVLALVLGFVGVTRVLAVQTKLDGTQASAMVRASPYAFWLAQVNHAGVCRMISGCVGSTGSEWRWRFRLQFDTPTGVQEVPASVRVVKQIPFRSMKLRVSADTILGDVDSVVTVALRGRSVSRTRVTIRLEHITATGLAAGYTDDFAAAFQPYLTARAQTINGELSATGARVEVRLNKARKPRAKVKVSTAGLSPTAPRVTGRLVVYAEGRAVCGARMRSSRAQCRFPAPRERAEVFAVVNGILEPGTPVWATGKVRYRP